MDLSSKILLAVALLVAGAFGGWEARGWKAAADESEALQVAVRDQARRAEHANLAASGYEAKRGAIVARQPEIAHALQDALEAPIPCAAASAPLADLVVPAVAVRSLRDAGADALAAPGGSGS